MCSKRMPNDWSQGVTERRIIVRKPEIRMSNPTVHCRAEIRSKQNVW